MQIGVSSYSFSRLVRSGEMAQIDVIAKAKEIGFDVIEFSSIAVPEGKDLPAFAAELRAEADRVGIDIVNYTIGADFLKGSGGDLAAEIERVKCGASYIVVESYRSEQEKANLLCWQNTCECIFTPAEWEWVLKRFGYTGDHSFVFFE